MYEYLDASSLSGNRQLHTMIYGHARYSYNAQWCASC